MYLNILLLSDISSPNGNSIDHSAYIGDREAMQSYHAGDSVHQAKPNDKAWAEWRKCLNLFCHRNQSHTLKEPLGAWTVPPHEYARDWALLYSTAEDAIYSSNDIDYSVHRQLRYDYDKDTDEYSDNLPSDAVPIEIKETPHTWIKPRHVAPQDIMQKDTEEDMSLAEMVKTMPPWE